MPEHDEEALKTAKLQKEVDKLTEEIAKLREDRRWHNRHLAVVGAICGVAATFAVGLAQYNTTRERNTGDGARAAREDHRREVETGLKLLQFAMERGSDLLAADADKQTRFIRLTSALLPPEEARRILDAFGQVVTQAQVLQQLAVLGSPVGAAAPAPIPPRPAAPGPTPPTPAPPGPVGTPSPPAPAGAPLTVFAHIAEENDRLVARGIAAGLGSAFPLAGVEYVPGWGARPRSSGEVRYYRRDQKDTAQELAARLAAATRAATGRDIPFVTRDLSEAYPNLPTGRIEVWFPQLP